MPGNDNDHPRTKLNNELQKMYGPSTSDHFRWEFDRQGPANDPTWHATIFIDDMNYGQASSPTKRGAQDEAASIAYNKLKRERS
ncbi:hypothetical protein BDR04DRAFT_1148506 [Suillus decipiens]|nr:hypothetical protein BDR04DRAFT_1148506 [Suillus decipiens]